ncbi:MAG: FAD:protein FMN transferase [Mycobacterium sp.]
MSLPTGHPVDEATWSRWSTFVHVVVTDPAALPAARREVDTEIDAIDAVASRFRADSEISALSRSAGRATPVSPLLAELIGAALEAARRTGGAVDPTVGGALIALGYDDAVPDRVEHVVPSATVSARWTMVGLDGDRVTVPAGVTLDLGSTAKAIAADRCAQRAFEATGCGVLVNLGGDIATAGPAPDDGWHVLVQDTDEDPGSAVTIGTACGLATSSTVRRRWLRDGDIAHHIIDPRSGLSAEPVWRTVSVVAPSCYQANTLSTAAIVWGADAVDRLRGTGLPARLVDRHFHEHVLGGWPPAARR